MEQVFASLFKRPDFACPDPLVNLYVFLGSEVLPASDYPLPDRAPEVGQHDPRHKLVIPLASPCFVQKISSIVLLQLLVTLLFYRVVDHSDQWTEAEVQRASGYPVPEAGMNQRL